MKNNTSIYLRFFFLVCDIILINTALLVCNYLLNKYYTPLYLNLYSCISASVIIWLLSTNLFSLYTEQTVVKNNAVFRSTSRSIVVYLFIFSIYSFLFTNTVNIVFLLSYYFVLASGLLLSRLLSRVFENSVIARLNNNEKVNVLAIASIGGHWVQLLRLMPLFNLSTNQVTFVSTWENVDNMVEGHKYHAVPDANRHNKFNLLKCGWAIFAIIISSRPQIIITTGAAPGLFGVLAGRLLGIKTVWIDSIANVEKLSLSGYIAIKLADRVYTQWEHLSNRKVVFAGNILEE